MLSLSFEDESIRAVLASDFTLLVSALVLSMDLGFCFLCRFSMNWVGCSLTKVTLWVRVANSVVDPWLLRVFSLLRGGLFAANCL